MRTRIPKLIHPCRFLILPQSFNNTNYDTTLKEPIGEKKYLQPIEMFGQFKNKDYYNFGLNTKPTLQGLEEENNSYILFRYVDADSKNWKPRHGDMIKTFYYKTPREIEMNVYINFIRPAGHLGEEPHLFRAYYTDKHPAMQGSGFSNVRFEE